MEVKRPLKTNDKKLYGPDADPSRRRTPPKVEKSYGSAQRRAMTPKDVSCRKM